MFKLINVKPCKNDVGAFIDADILSSSPEAIEEMKIALDEYGVIFFRKQNLDSSSYVKFAKQFGTCADYPMLKGLDGFPEITVVEKNLMNKLCLGRVGTPIPLILKNLHDLLCYIPSNLHRKEKEILCLHLNTKVTKAYQRNIRRKFKI